MSDIIQASKDIHEQSKLFSEVVTACKKLLQTAPQAAKHKEYIQNRLSNYSINKFDIGFFPPDHELPLLYSMVDKSILEKLKLVYPKDIQQRGYFIRQDKGILHYHNLIIPFKDEYGNIISLSGRTLLDSKEQKELEIQKYKNTFFNKSLHLFGTYQTNGSIERNNKAFIVEGQIDCISCQANGFFNTVAMNGSDLSMYQVFLLKKMTNKIYLLLDNDDAGKKAADKIIRKYSGYINIKKLTIPDPYKDIDEYLKGNADYSVFDVS